MLYCGMDAGSRAIKGVIYDSDTRGVVCASISDQGPGQGELAQKLLEELLEKSGIGRDGLRGIVATGYARDIIEFADRTVTEITCHARGVHRLLPEARTVIEIGGQDSKILWLDPDGAVRDFLMNDRCAAGTGRFIEVIAQRLGIELCDLGANCRICHEHEIPSISSKCVVFAETEIVGHLASGIPGGNIISGVQASIASRIAAMVGKKLVTPVAFTGGVATVPGMREAIASALGAEVDIVDNPQFTGALGAAIIASEKL